MDIKINNVYFNKVVSEVSRAVSFKTHLPILTGIKITATKDGLKVIGSNADVSIETNIPNIVNGEEVLDVFKIGSVVISAKYLSHIVKKLPNDIHMHVNENNVITIESGDIKTNLNGFNPADYPNLPDFDDNKAICIAGNEVVEMIKQTVFAVSKSETRPVLTGVHMSFQEDRLTLVATNSHRLALRTHRKSSNNYSACIVPSSALVEVTKLFAAELEMINIFISDNYIVFKSNSTSLYSRLIEGNYPDISSLLPRVFKTTITVDNKQSLNGIDRACLFANEWRNNNVHLEISGGNKVKISSNSTEIGKIEETQNIKFIEGESELSISLDGKFATEALKAIKEDEISIRFSGAMGPILIQPIGNDAHLHLISPVRACKT
ncbi:DNA polymerase III subunit beta [Bacillus sp. 2205SS5-2]|uniref:DNA polymerase III subunit beta n=1 Tax=Bacillus sp. 2205SS5-2 TaxID=3109031 RepID=UPI0030050406